MYQALYRKWRPRTFDDVVGQEHITTTLKHQVAAGRTSHAYLFTGTRGTGKTSCAKILSRAVNCEHPEDGSPCNRCPSCTGIESGSILDVVELDAASNNRVDDVRAILDEAVYTPVSVKKRVYIVDEVHMLSGQAFNALLQTLEEPPEHVMFILATTELHKVPATIKSRCQQFAFKRIRPEAIAGRLAWVAEQEGLELTGEGAALLARLADGGMRDALSLLDRCAGEHRALGEAEIIGTLGLAGHTEATALLECAARGDTEGALTRLDRLYAGGKEMSALLGELSGLARDLLVRRAAPKNGGALLTGGCDPAVLDRLGKLLDTPRLLRMTAVLQQTAAGLTRSPNRRIDTELCLVSLCDPRMDDSPAGLAVRLSALEEQLARGAVRVPAQAAEESAVPHSTRPARGGEGAARHTPSAACAPVPEKAPDEPDDPPPFDDRDGPPPFDDRDGPPPFDDRDAPPPFDDNDAPPPPEDPPPWGPPEGQFLQRTPPAARTPPAPAQAEGTAVRAGGAYPPQKEGTAAHTGGAQPQKRGPDPAAVPAAPVEHPPVQKAAPSAPRAVAAITWPALRTRLEQVMSIADFCFVGNADMVTGRVEGQTVTLWANSDFVRGFIDKPDILKLVADTAGELAGTACHAQVRVGQPPAAPPVGDDPLDALSGLANVTEL